MSKAAAQLQFRKAVVLVDGGTVDCLLWLRLNYFLLLMSICIKRIRSMGLVEGVISEGTVNVGLASTELAHGIQLAVAIVNCAVHAVRTRIHDVGLEGNGHKHGQSNHPCHNHAKAGPHRVDTPLVGEGGLRQHCVVRTPWRGHH